MKNLLCCGFSVNLRLTLPTEFGNKILNINIVLSSLTEPVRLKNGKSVSKNMKWLGNKLLNKMCLSNKVTFILNGYINILQN